MSAALECICPPETRRRETYVIGCPACTHAAATRPPTAWANAEAFTVTYFRASVKISTPVVHDDGEVWSSETYKQCEHQHDTPEAAERCAKRLARTITTNVRTR